MADSRIYRQAPDTDWIRPEGANDPVNPFHTIYMRMVAANANLRVIAANEGFLTDPKFGQLTGMLNGFANNCAEITVAIQRLHEENPNLFDAWKRAFESA